MRAAHADQVLAVYQLGIDEGRATFETTAPTWAQFDTSKLPDRRHVALGTLDGPPDRLLGWIATSAVSARSAYAGVVEHSVHVHPGARRRGVGLALLRPLIASTEPAGIWTIQSGIFPKDAASLTLHARAGFRVIGVRERIGRHHGIWHQGPRVVRQRLFRRQ
ncbi:N-acetyltransferase family protein [Nonomuraea sp. NPDC004186]